MDERTEDAQWKAIDRINDKIDELAREQVKNDAIIRMLQQNYKDSLERLLIELAEIRTVVLELKRVSDVREGSARTSKYIVALFIALAGVVGGWIQSVLK